MLRNQTTNHQTPIKVVDPTGTKSEGELLRYGDEVVLLDDQRFQRVEILLILIANSCL